MAGMESWLAGWLAMRVMANLFAAVCVCVCVCVLRSIDANVYLSCLWALQYLGGFKGSWNKAPSGVSQTEKLALLKAEGVEFDGRGMLVDSRCWWDEFRI